MRYDGSWMSRGIVLAVFVLVGLAALPALQPLDGSAASPGGSALQSPAADPATPTEFALTDFADSLEAGSAANQAQPVAICRLLPECWSDSDCDLRCGVGRGKCIHNKCPVRICRCS